MQGNEELEAQPPPARGREQDPADEQDDRTGKANPDGERRPSLRPGADLSSKSDSQRDRKANGGEMADAERHEAGVHAQGPASYLPGRRTALNPQVTFRAARAPRGGTGASRASGPPRTPSEGCPPN